MIPSELARLKIHDSIISQTFLFLIYAFFFVRFGLGAAILSKDLERCERFTKVRVVPQLRKTSFIHTQRHCFLQSQG